MTGTTDNLGIAEVATNQVNAPLVISTALNDLDDATQNPFPITFVSNELTLTATQFTRNFCFIGGDVGGNLTATGTLTIPATNREFAVRNDGSVESIVVTAGTVGVNATVAPNSLNNIFSDGTNVVANSVPAAFDITIASNPFLNAGVVSSGDTVTPATLAAQSLIGSHSTVATDLAIAAQFTITSGNTFGFNSSLVDLSGFTEVKVPAPVNASDAATKAYADAAIQGLSIKPTAVVATITTLPAYTYSNGSSGIGATLTATSTGTLTIDGHLTALGDVILVKNETSTNQPNNGLYTVTTAGASGVAYVLTRSVDMDASAQFTGAIMAVGEVSATYPGTLWLCNQTAPTVGTTNIAFTEVSAVATSQWSAGTVSSISANFTVISNTLSLAPTLDLTGLTEVKVPVGANATDAVQKTYVDNATGLGLILQGYLSGLTILIASNTTFTIATGQAMSDDNTTMMTLASAITKSSAGTWVVGSASNGLDTGTVANSTWYFAWLIYDPTHGITDILFSLSATSPTMPTNYTKKRLLGPLRTGASTAPFLAIIQTGDRFDYPAPVNTLNNSSIGNTTANTQAIFAPSGIVVEAMLQVTMTDATNANSAIWVSSLAQTDTGAAGAAGTVTLICDAAGTFASIDGLRVETNTSAQIRYRQNLATAAFYLSTSGFIFKRGASGGSGGSVWNAGLVSALNANQLTISGGTLQFVTTPTITNLDMTGTLAAFPITGNSAALNGGSILAGGTLVYSPTTAGTVTLAPTIGIKDVIVNMPSAGAAMVLKDSGVVAYQEYKLHIKQGATASTVTMPTDWVYANTGGPTSYTLTATANLRDILWIENLDGTHSVFGAILQGISF